MCKTDDRQTDHATEKCVEIGGIACAALQFAIPPRNWRQYCSTCAKIRDKTQNHAKSQIIDITQFE